jgi:DNA-binding response OmpR family regulator
MLYPTVSASNRPRVLIADDEKLIADTLALILNQGGFEARAVYTCRKALEIASSFQPDLLISDVLMADINGIDAAIQMRALLPDIRVFLLSGQTATSEMIAKSHARDLGFEVLVKPVHPQELMRRLKTAVIQMRSVA